MLRAVFPPALAFVVAVMASMAHAIDPHALFEQRCSRCHDAHAGDFARERLSVDDGIVRSSKTKRDVRALLEDHYGGLDTREIEALLDMFARQVEAGGLFQERCRICHDPAKVLARRELIVIEDELRGRYTGRDIGDFLLGHGRSSPEEATILYDMRKWQVETGR